MSDDEEPTFLLAQRVMRAGLAGAFVTMVVGLVIHLVSGRPASAVRFSTFTSSGELGDRVLMVGALILAATPAVQIVVLAVQWWREGDRRFALVAVAVVAALVLGVLVGHA